MTVGNESKPLSGAINSSCCSLSMSSNGNTPTSSSSSFKTLNTNIYRFDETCFPVATMRKHAALAEAENMDYLDDMTTNDSGKTVCGAVKQNSSAVVLSPLEKISNEAREYWATLDLYNNSKMAFNKRSKSVKLKREKLNTEWQKRLQVQAVAGEDKAPRPLHETAADSEQCKCVKCSISYHESLIQKEAVCKRCNSKLLACKCCSSSSHSMGGGSDAANTSLCLKKVITSSSFGHKTLKAPSQTSTNETYSDNTAPIPKNEFTKFEEKLFDIKHELVSFFLNIKVEDNVKFTSLPQKCAVFKLKKLLHLSIPQKVIHSTTN